MNDEAQLPAQDELLDFGSHGKKHDESEAIWLISYSDMMTLLMGFFALLLSMSTLDMNKTSELQQEAAKKFGGNYQKPLGDLQSELQKLIDQNHLQDQISVESIPTGVLIIFKGAILFDSGSFNLNKNSQAVLDKFIPIIRQKAYNNYYYYFEGHTDNDPIKQNIIASNWELSGLRASNIARKFESQGFDRFRMTVIGWGDIKPIVANTDSNGRDIPENKAKNRRITIKISNTPANI